MDSIRFSSPANDGFEALPSCSLSSLSDDVFDFLSASASPPPEDEYCTFLKAYPTALHSSPSSSGRRLRVFWSHDDPQPIQDKIRCAFQNLQLDYYFGGIIQFWAPVKPAGGRQLLTTSGQPFVLRKKVSLIEIPETHRSCSLKYQYNVDLNNLDVKDDLTIIPNGAPAVAFLNQLPELLTDLRVLPKKNPLLSSALECELKYSGVLPVFDPSQSDCVGVVECFTSKYVDLLQLFNKLNIALEKQGLKTFDAQEHLPYKTICGLQNAKDEIDEALKIIWHAHRLPFAQVRIRYEDENQVAFSSSLQDTRTKRMLWLKLTGHISDAFWDDGTFERFQLENYSTAHYRLPMKMDEMFAGNTLENYEPHFIQNINKLNGDHQHRLFHQRRFLFSGFKCCFFTFLRSTKTGDLDYVFEFLWSDEGRNTVILLESLLSTLKRYLPSFKFASGTKLGDEIDILDVENSTASENKYIKIFHRNKISLKRGRQSKVEECLAPLKERGKTTLIKLSPEQIKSQFGQTQKEAASKLGVSVATLKRKCDDQDIKWQGKDRSKGNVKHSYKNQSNTSEEEDQGGAIQDPSSTIIRQTPLDENILTIEAEYAGDDIKFPLPISSATFEAIQKKIVEKFNLDPAAKYKLKYLDDESKKWFLFTCDEDVTLCTKNKRSVQLHLLQLGPSDNYQLT